MECVNTLLMGEIYVHPLDGVNSGLSIASIISIFSTLIAPKLHREISAESTGLAARFSIKKLNLDTNSTDKNRLMVLPIELINSGKLYLILEFLIGLIIHNISVTIA